MNKAMSLGLIIILELFLLQCCSTTGKPEVTRNSYEEINVFQEPIQVNLETDQQITIEKKNLNITVIFKAEYSISALVVSTKKYRSGNWDHLVSPVDFALAWGDLTKPEVLEKVKFSQSNRWYYFEYQDGFPYDLDFIYTHSSNTHIIPANENIWRAAVRVKKGKKVKMDGYLVRIKGTYKNSEIWWNSSLSRKDRGDGACEVFYVTRLQVDDEVFE